MQVAFLELMIKEAAGYRNELITFKKKLEAARMLFPEDLKRLKEDLDTI
ncbi:MAG: hypothetical protein JSS64_07090 [Bacteroidetes bacterium]|nr:hypothetical protein [Bacteroidota bacterium]